LGGVWWQPVAPWPLQVAPLITETLVSWMLLS
jgi:hypothetical protein